MYKFIKPNHHPVNKKGLVAWYSYRNTGSVVALGTWKDYSGNGNDGTLVDNAYINRQGVNCDGIGDHVNIATPSTAITSMTRVTVAAWVKLNNIAVYQGVIDCFTDTNNQFSLQYHSSGEWRFRVGNGAGNVAAVSETAPNIGELSFVVGVYDGALVYIYVNGVLKGTVSLAGNLSLGASPPLHIGYYAISVAYLNGVVDDTLVYNRALSAGEIMQNYLKNKRG